MNQCDGCRRGLPLKDGMHKGEGTYDVIGCTAGRYDEWNRVPLPDDAPADAKAIILDISGSSDLRLLIRSTMTGAAHQEMHIFGNMRVMLPLKERAFYWLCKHKPTIQIIGWVVT